MVLITLQILTNQLEYIGVLIVPQQVERAFHILWQDPSTYCGKDSPRLWNDEYVWMFQLILPCFSSYMRARDEQFDYECPFCRQRKLLLGSIIGNSLQLFDNLDYILELWSYNILVFQECCINNDIFHFKECFSCQPEAYLCAKPNPVVPSLTG